MTGEQGEGRSRGQWFTRFAWFVLFVNVTIVLGGALVRATGSGAGCGGHWPLCNGEVLPSTAAQATLIESVHRLARGLALVLVGMVWFWALRRFPRSHTARRWAWAALALILVEALLGAGPLASGWVGADASMGRAVSIALYVITTYALLASLAMAAWHGGDTAPERILPPVPAWAAAGLAGGMVFVGISGSITALGETLFPAAMLGQGVREHIASGATFIVRLRALHPLLASVLAAAGILWVDARRKAVTPSAVKWRLTWLRGLLLIQLAAGAANVILLAPVWLQIGHLFVALATWLLLIICLAEGLQGGSGGKNPFPVEMPA